MKYVLLENGENPSLVISYEESKELITYSSSHPAWDNLLELAKSGKLGEMAEYDVLAIVNTSLRDIPMVTAVKDRVKITTRGATLDGTTIDSDLARGIKAVLGDTELPEDHMAAIERFLDRADSNPSMENSEKLYRWIASENLTITSDGHFIGYKSVSTVDKDMFERTFPGTTYRPNGDGPEDCSKILEDLDKPIYRSSVAGGGIVDGIEFPGYVPNYVGAVVEMPRDKVDNDGYTECSVGLHVGTYQYASTFTGDMMLLVKVDPADVVSVPEYDFHKLRACRYTVIASDVSGKLDSKVYIDEEFAPVYTPKEDDKPVNTSSLVSRIIDRIKASRM